VNKIYSFLQKNKKQYVYFPLVLYWLILLVATSLPSKAVPAIGIHDKFEHFFAYLILSLLLGLTFHFQNKWENLNQNWLKWTVIVGIFYGIIDELHQYFIPGRFCEFLDLLSNTLGIVFGIILVKVFIDKSRTSVDTI